MTELVARLIMESIIADIENRSGIGNEWEEIDKTTQEEIKNEWTRIIMQIVNE